MDPIETEKIQHSTPQFTSRCSTSLSNQSDHDDIEHRGQRESAEKAVHAIHTLSTARASETTLGFDNHGLTAQLSTATTNALLHQQRNPADNHEKYRHHNPVAPHHGQIPPPAVTLQYLRQVSNVHFAKALLAQKPRLWTKSMFKLYCILLLGFINSFINGYDGSIMGGINAMQQYQEYFHMKKAGSSTGIVFMIYSVGHLCGSLFVGPITDKWGRRWGMFIASAIIIVGSVVQGTTTTKNIFMCGRFVCGFGASILVVAGPIYVAEMAHPAWRGPMTGLYNTFYYAGAISAAWIMYGTEKIQSDSAWRLPLWFQIVGAGMVVLGSLFCPETPRWLVSNDCNEGAINVITRYYGEGNRRSPIVLLTYKEMVQEILLEGSDKRWWDFSELWNTPDARTRLVCIGGMALFGQWSGNGVVTYFLPVLLDGVGITDQGVQLLNNAVLFIASWVCAIAGALLVDKVGRRPMLLCGTFSFIILWSVIAGLTSFYADADNVVANPAGGIATMAMIYLFILVFSFSYTSLQVLYPVECLKYETRAKGMGLFNVITNIAAIFNTYGMAVIINRIQWSFCFIYILWNIVEFTYIYFLFVETKDRTLEEINEIFAAKDPVKKSLKKHVVIVSETDQFLGDYSLGSSSDENESEEAVERRVHDPIEMKDHPKGP